jgi:hypothetical protein
MNTFTLREPADNRLAASPEDPMNRNQGFGERVLDLLESISIFIICKLSLHTTLAQDRRIIR